MLISQEGWQMMNVKQKCFVERLRLSKIWDILVIAKKEWSVSGVFLDHSGFYLEAPPVQFPFEWPVLWRAEQQFQMLLNGLRALHTKNDDYNYKALIIYITGWTINK